MLWQAAAAVPPSGDSEAAARLIRCIHAQDRPCLVKELKGSGEKRAPGYLSAAAEGYLLLGRNPEAIQALQEALRQKPGDFDLLMQQGRTFQRSGDQVRAIQSFLLASTASTPSAVVFYNIGISFFLLHEYDRAAKHFQHAIQLDEKSHKAEFMLAVVNILKDNDEASARAHLERALSLQPENPHYLLHYGILLAQHNDRDEAAAVLDKAVRADPSNPLAHFNLGRVCRQMGHMGRARAELEIAVRLRPDLARAHYQLAAVYRATGEGSKARQAMEQFLKYKDQDQDDEPVDGPPSYAFRDKPDP